MMTSLERSKTTIAGGIPDQVPIALHNFLQAARIVGIPLSECLQSGERMAESHIASWRRFWHDMILVENGTTAVAQALGCGVEYRSDVAPRVIDPILKDLKRINDLRIPDPQKDFPLNEVLKAIRILRRELGDKVFIMGRADQAPMALAAAIRGHEQFLLDLGECEDPTIIHRVLDICAEAATRYALALQEAGAHGTSIGEFGSDVISPAMYRQYALPHLKKFFAAMRKANFPAALHQCGNSVAVLPDMIDSGANILELDVHTDPSTVKRITQGKTAVLGMVDPANVVHRGTPALVEKKSRYALDILAPGGGYIIGPGCALMPETPEENVLALVETARKFGRYRSDGTLEQGS